MTPAETLINSHRLSREEYAALLIKAEDERTRELLKTEAVRLRRKYYGNKVFTRGLIEFTNYCKNDCFYCGIRKSNINAKRYRLSEEDILECCNCAVTLSIGEKSYESYRKFREAGADRYLLRHETADEEHYRMLHPENMYLSKRKQCLYNLKALGYQTGAGFMVGSPGQTLETLAADLEFLQELKPQMVGIGPFIPHHGTKYADEKAGSVSLTLFLLSVIRIMLPKVLLPATTALGTADSRGREKGLEAGANVVMPNLSPLRNRKQYDLYDNKICTGDEAAECRTCLARRVASVGYRLADERGDALE